MLMTAKGYQQLKSDEGFRNFVYDDKDGKSFAKGPSGGTPTIGYGRNLAVNGISLDEADYLLQNDVSRITTRLPNAYSWVFAIDPVWFDVMIMICYNAGNVALFPKFLAALSKGDAKTAHDELLNSNAAKELPFRYGRMAAAILASSW